MIGRARSPAYFAILGGEECFIMSKVIIDICSVVIVVAAVIVGVLSIIRAAEAEV